MAEDVSCRRPCNARLDVLSKPTKRRVLHLWKNYISLFSEGRKETIRLLLQELYAMTPEETQKYFDEISAVIKKLAARKKLRARMAKQYHIKLRRFERKRALRLFRRVFIRALTYACKNPVPPLVTPRLRYMSDLILEQLCDIRGVNVPQRTDCARQAQFLCNLADWISITVEHIYYEIHVQKNREFDIIEASLKADELRKLEEMKTVKKKRICTSKF